MICDTRACQLGKGMVKTSNEDHTRAIRLISEIRQWRQICFKKCRCCHDDEQYQAIMRILNRALKALYVSRARYS